MLPRRYWEAGEREEQKRLRSSVCFGEDLAAVWGKQTRQDGRDVTPRKVHGADERPLSRERKVNGERRWGSVRKVRVEMLDPSMNF